MTERSRSRRPHKKIGNTQSQYPSVTWLLADGIKRFIRHFGKGTESTGHGNRRYLPAKRNPRYAERSSADFSARALASKRDRRNSAAAQAAIWPTLLRWWRLLAIRATSTMAAPVSSSASGRRPWAMAIR